jgi:hypothetical protein
MKMVHAFEREMLNEVKYSAVVTHACWVLHHLISNY